MRGGGGHISRRRSERFALQQSLSGELTLFHDVTIDSWSASSVWVRSVTRLPRDQVLALATGRRGDERHPVRVTVAIPSLWQGVICHRMRLEAMTPLPEQAASTRVGRDAWLWHHIPVHLVEISRGGCRLESPTPLAAGRIARVSVTMAERQFVDDGRVAWCRLVEGGSAYLIGVETLAAPRGEDDAASLRDALAAADGLET